MTAEARRVETTPGEAMAVTAICFGWAILASLHSVLAGYPAGGGFSDAAALFTVTIEFVCAAISLAVLRHRGYDIASLLPRPTWRDSAIGLGLFVIVWVTWLLAALLMASRGGDEPIQRMLRASTISVPTAILASFVNAAFEEVFLLGFLQRGLARHGLSISLGVMLLVRMLYHLYQGPEGAVLVLCIGAVLGLSYLRLQRLWPVVFVHALWDIYAFVN